MSPGKVGGFLRFKDHDVAVDDLHSVGAYRHSGRRCIQGSRAEAEPGGVKGALNPAVLYIAASQRGILVRKRVIDGEELTVLSVENGEWRSSIEP